MLLNTFYCNKKETIVKNQNGAREHAELIIPLTGLLTKPLTPSEKGKSSGEQIC